MSQSFYLSGTVDNLTATSSPIQMVLDDKRPGDNLARIDKNKTAWLTVCGPLLARELGTNLWMGGDKFSVLDVIVGYSLAAVYSKRGWDSEELDNLKQLYNRIAERDAFKRAFGVQ